MQRLSNGLSTDPRDYAGHDDIQEAMANLILAAEHPRVAATVVLDAALLAVRPVLGDDLLHRSLLAAAQRIKTMRDLEG